MRCALTYQTGGLWTGRCWGHPILLVSARQAPVEEDTVPLWLIEGDPPPRALGELVVQRVDLLALYASWLRGLQPELWKEVRAMAKTKGIIDWEAVAGTGEDVVEIVRYLPPEQVIEVLGTQKAIEVIGTSKVIEVLGTQRAIDAIGLDKVIATVGLDKVIATVGLDKVIATVGLDKVIAAAGAENAFKVLQAQLTREEIQDMLKRPQGEDPPAAR